MRSTADIFAPVFGILGAVVLFSKAAEVPNANAELNTAKSIPAVVVR